MKTHRDLDVWKEGIELETQLIISKNVGFLFDTDIFERLEALKSKLLGLIRYLKEKRGGK
jgi:hypothetical protein